jgi:small subunit ribosomal protein S1
MTKTSSSVMETLLKDSPVLLRPRPGELVEGTVIFKAKNKLLLDLAGVATGIISGRELRDSFGTFKNLAVGSKVTALVLEEENDEGMIIMSLRMASQQKAWDRFRELIDNDETMEFVAQEANKGGLLCNMDGIRAFLPVSQLAPMNYPRVNNADTAEIIKRLSKFIGHTFLVKIITMDEDAGKIVVSEREAMSEERIVEVGPTALAQRLTLVLDRTNLRRRRDGRFLRRVDQAEREGIGRRQQIVRGPAGLTNNAGGPCGSGGRAQP